MRAPFSLIKYRILIFHLLNLVQGTMTRKQRRIIWRMLQIASQGDLSISGLQLGLLAILFTDGITCESRSGVIMVGIRIAYVVITPEKTLQMHNSVWGLDTLVGRVTARDL